VKVRQNNGHEETGTIEKSLAQKGYRTEDITGVFLPICTGITARTEFAAKTGSSGFSFRMPPTGAAKHNGSIPKSPTSGEKSACACWI
jgi:hypothetical protein